MNRLAPIGLVVALGLGATAALAESIAASAASSASITASSASESSDASSDSSKSGNRTARAGDYRIEAMTAAEQPGKVRLALRALQPTPEHQGFTLVLPQTALEPQGLSRGDTVSVRERTTAPPCRRGLRPANIACRIEGTPGRTWTLPMVKPGATLTGLSISSAPSGVSAIFIRASLTFSGG